MAKADKIKEYRNAIKADLAKRRLENIVKKDLEDQLVKKAFEKNKTKPIIGHFQSVIRKKAPKLLDKEYHTAIVRLERIPHLRTVENWKPKGKGSFTQFVSLAEHLLAKYRMPKFIWSVFFINTGLVDSSKDLISVVCRVANGESLANICKAGEFAFPFNKKQCHLFMAQLQPLVDFIANRRHRDNNFSMKGRSPNAMIEAMHTWHDEIRKIKTFKLYNFSASGFKPKSYEIGKAHEIWSITEILDSKKLKEEGDSLHHCVYSYAQSIASGEVSIWSMRLNDTRVITLEVRNKIRRIVQARGMRNAPASNKEYTILSRWASDNSLLVAC